MLNNSFNSDLSVKIDCNDAAYSEIDTLRENLIFSIVSSSKVDLSAFERIYIIANLDFTKYTNQRWLVDLYMKCGCFSEAKKIFLEFGHWRKLGDLACIDGDLCVAKEYYSKGEEREKQVFRGSKDWDRLLKLAFYQSSWDEFVKIFIEAGITSIDKNNIVLGSSGISSKPYQKMIAVAISKATRSYELELVQKIAQSFSMELSELQSLITAASAISEEDLRKLQDKAQPKLTKTPSIDLDSTLRKGNTFNANKVIATLKNLENHLHDSTNAVQQYFKKKKASYLSVFLDAINGFIDESIAKTFITSVISHVYDFIDNASNFHEVIYLYESHPLLRRMYFGELLKLKFNYNIPITPLDIYTGLLQSIVSVESDITGFVEKNKKSLALLDFDKIISYADWVEMKIANWLTCDGKPILQNVISAWKTGKALAVKTVFNHSKRQPNNPREMAEWLELLKNCHKYITQYWEIEIGIDKWKSEKSLFEIVKKRLKGHEVLRHAQPLWLEPQHLDIYIPDLLLAIEYMGEQHFRPVDFFGGKDAYEANLQRDERKTKLCKKVGIHLFHIRYDDDIGKKLDEILSKIAEGFPSLRF
jgi:hypothetical protein